MKDMLEKNLETYFTKNIKSKNYLSFKFISTTTGIPDRIVISPDGKVTFVELKRESGKLSPRQIYIHKKLKEYKNPPITLYGLKQIKEFIASL